LIDQLLAGLFGYGYLLAFVVSLLGSLLVFVPIPYFPLLILLATRLDPLALTLAASAGASMAKFVVFMVSFWGGTKVSPERKRRITPLGILAQKYGSFAVFIAAATPIPDDLIYIPLGLVRFNPISFLIATFVGKLVINAIIVYGSAFTLWWVFLFVGNVKGPVQFWVTSLLLLIGIALAVYFVVTLDWEDILVRRLKWVSPFEVEEGDRGQSSSGGSSSEGSSSSPSGS
jgi:membrane protein DedA with SNARE-associated domain